MQVNLLRNTLQSNQDGRPIVRPLRVEFLAVAGGGGASYGRQQTPQVGGSGGGAGGVITGSFCAEKNTNYPISVGNGGAIGGVSGSNGDDTTLFGVTAIGGGGGVDANLAAGLDGGSGGGGGTTGGTGLQPGASYSGFGNDGSGRPGATDSYGGAGGGAGAAASNQNGGDGIQLDFTGTSVYYGGGGRGAGPNGLLGTSGLGDIGHGGDAFVSADPGDPTPGNGGIVVIRYDGAPKATGGTITESNGKTFHTFTSGSVENFVVTKNEDNFALNNCNDGTSV